MVITRVLQVRYSVTYQPSDTGSGGRNQCCIVDFLAPAACSRVKNPLCLRPSLFSIAQLMDFIEDWRTAGTCNLCIFKTSLRHFSPAIDKFKLKATPRLNN